MEAGLIPRLIDELRLKGEEKRIFIMKVGMIHSMFMRIQQAEAEAEQTHA